MFSDFHTHTEFSGDSTAPAAAQIEQAIQLGMDEICITDHHDHDVPVPGDIFELDIDAYLPYMKEMQKKYEGQIRVGVGIELGLQLHLKEYLNDLTEKYSFDFIIGSSHFVDGHDPYYPDFFVGKTEREAYERYFEVTLRRIRELDCYDVFGHLDYIVRYGPNKNRYYDLNSYRDAIDPILKSLIEKGKGLECNTGGYKYNLGHPNPSEDILIRYRELGGEILTIGSDGHAPEQLGYDFVRLKPVLLRCGFRYYTVYHNRTAEFVKID